MKKTLPPERRIGRRRILRDRRAPTHRIRRTIHQMMPTDEFLDNLALLMDFPEFNEEIVKGFINRLERLSKERGGDVIYIPKKSGNAEKAKRNELIKSKFTGDNLSELSKEFNLSERMIRMICKKK